MAEEKIETACPNCGRVQKYPLEGRGHKGRCRGCKTAFKIGVGTPWIVRGEQTVEAAMQTVEAAAGTAESAEPASCCVCETEIPAGQPGGMCAECFERGIAKKPSRCHVDRGGCGQSIDVGDWQTEGGLCLDCFARKAEEAEASDEGGERCKDCRQEFSVQELEDGRCGSCRQAIESARRSRGRTGTTGKHKPAPKLRRGRG